MLKMHWGVVVIFIVAIALPTAAQMSATSWDSCQDDLDRMKKTAAEASDAAGDAHRKMEDYEECRNDPETYDLLRDDCRSLKSDYESAVGEVENTMEELDSRLRDVQSSCDYNFTINRMTSAEAAQHHLSAAQQRLCSSYKHLVPLATSQNVLQMCKAQQGEQWCKACLGIP